MGFISNNISGTTISGTTFYGDGSYLTGISGGGSFTGGTVTGSTTFTNTVSANTMSATTLYVGGNSISQPYKVYTALISQNGTNAPTTDVILENTLGYTPPPYKVSVNTFSGGTLTDGLLNKTPIEIRIYN